MFDDTLPYGEVITLPILAVHGEVALLSSYMFDVEAPSGRAAVERAREDDRLLGVVTCRDPTMRVDADAAPSDVYDVGMLMNVHSGEARRGTYKAHLVGAARMRVVEWLDEGPALMARVAIEPQPDDGERVRDASERLTAVVRSLLGASENPMVEMGLELLHLATSPAAIADTIAASVLDVSISDKQKLVETFDVPARLALVAGWVRRDLVG